MELRNRSKQMFELYERLPTSKSPHSRESVQRQIETTDRQIDRLVYQLYGLTEAEISIVEQTENQPNLATPAE